MKDGYSYCSCGKFWDFGVVAEPCERTDCCMRTPMKLEIRKDPEVRGHFCAGDMEVAWYAQPNFLFLWAARMAGWKWREGK